jgi:GDP-L-fucose synthase
MKKIFITGGTGFIGRNLKEQLDIKYEIFAPSSTELNLLDDEKVSEYIKKHHFDVIIHTATWNATRNSNKDLTKVLEYNLRMFFNIARCSKYYGKMIYYSSGAEFDREHWIPKMREDYFDTYVPKDDYGFSKYIMNKYTGNTENVYNLRLFGIFGKYEDFEIRFISNACCKAVWDLPITIKQNVFFDYMYVDDVVKITEWFIENESREKTYNICTGKTFDLLALANKVLAVSNKKLDIIVNKEGFGIEYSGDNTKLLSEIGGYSFRTIDDCIYELYHWYLSQKNSIDRNKLLFDK